MSSRSSVSPSRPSTLVLGLGNPILGDDGVGWRVVEEVERRLAPGGEPARPDRPPAPVECDYFALGGIALMERLIGYRRVILVDAIRTHGGAVGAVYRLGVEDLPTLHADSAHDASLRAALELGRRLGAALPDDIIIYAVEAANLYEFRETLTPAVAAVVPEAAQAVLHELTSQATFRA